eukprot:TRINITY_DN57550_c0_g1_i1.p2 TRINITY_DN57550_c0_g1~~TRINITY_DN57550_c0_g1_i1.p2  ORF type:complete len:305 (-),score=41.26 TRINITY_DN57550_c0_g1_i1:1184-2098(-)
MKDLYSVLEVDFNASDETIKKSYRQQALNHHPDKCGSDHTKFLEIKEAYEVLSDAQQRQQYNVELLRSAEEQEANKLESLQQQWDQVSTKRHAFVEHCRQKDQQQQSEAKLKRNTLMNWRLGNSDHSSVSYINPRFSGSATHMEPMSRRTTTNARSSLASPASSTSDFGFNNNKGTTRRRRHGPTTDNSNNNNNTSKINSNPTTKRRTQFCVDNTPTYNQLIGDGTGLLLGKGSALDPFADVLNFTWPRCSTTVSTDVAPELDPTISFLGGSSRSGASKVGLKGARRVVSAGTRPRTLPGLAAW